MDTFIKQRKKMAWKCKIVFVFCLHPTVEASLCM